MTRQIAVDPGLAPAVSYLRVDRRIVTAFLVSRVVIVLAAVLAETVLPRNPALTSGDGAPLLRSLTAWDGWWYVGIARDGYHAAPLAGGYHDYAFLPLYPAVVAALSWPWPALAGAISVVLSNVLCLLGLGLLARLGEPYLGEERASRAAALLAIAPFSAVFAMAYSESLFLVLSVGAFLAMERGHRATAGLLIGLASLTRLQGAVLVLPLALLGWLRDGRRWRPSLLWLALGPLAVAAFLAYVAWLTGSVGSYGDAQSAWGRSGVGGEPAGGSLGSALSIQNIVSLVTLLVAVFVLLFFRRDFRRNGIPWPYALVPVLFLAAVFASGILESVGRYVLLAFPLAWLLACRGQRFQQWWQVASVALLFATAAASFAGWMVP